MDFWTGVCLLVTEIVLIVVTRSLHHRGATTRRLQLTIWLSVLFGATVLLIVATAWLLRP